MTEETDQGSRSNRQRVSDAARRVAEPLTSARDAVTGRGVERQVAEYSETFTHVVLGLHEDLTAANRRISNLEDTVAELTNSVSKSRRRLNRISVAAVIVALAALAALGVALWAAL